MTDVHGAPRDWRSVRLGEIATFAAGRTPPRDVGTFWEVRGDGGVPWVTIGDMRPYGVVQSTAERISEQALSEVFKGRLVSSGTLLMSFKLTIGRVATLGVDACHNEAIVAIYPSEGVHQGYLGYFLSQVDYGLYQDRAIKGNTLNREKLERIEVLLPPMDEQRRIAEVLSAIRQGIATQDRILATAQELKQATMQALFRRGLRREEQKETEIGPVPASWRVGRLGALAQFQRGFDITKKGQEPGGVPVVSSGGVRSWHNKAVAKAPGVVIGRKGSIGSVYFMDADYWPHDTTLWSKDLLGNDARFVYYRIQLLDLKRLDSGAANPALNRNFLHEEIVSWPVDAAEQREIGEALALIDEKLALHERKRAALVELFETLLHGLVTGRLRTAGLGPVSA